MQKIKAGVIGVGYLGKFHAEKYHKIESCELVGVFDTDSNLAQQIASTYQCQAFNQLEDLLSAVDVVSVVTPTPLHYQITKTCLEKGVHCMVEKPFTENLDEAYRLIDLKNKLGLKIQVGHLERYNPAFRQLVSKVQNPLYIEASRYSPYILRSIDSSVLLDLMIHDVDLVLETCWSPVKQIDAHGMKILSETIDIAIVRITFESGCIADIKSGRLSPKTTRKIRVFQQNGYFSVDFNEQNFKSSIKENSTTKPENMASIQRQFEKEDMIYLEIESFLKAVQEDRETDVPPEEATRALKIVLEASSKINL